MVLKIRQSGLDGHFRIEIDNEVWEFCDKDAMMIIMTELVRLKDNYGRINKELKKHDYS
jgi:hypothetical protein